MKNIYVIVVAGGSSTRMDGINKLLIDVDGNTLIEKTVSKFLMDGISGIIVVSSDENVIDKVKSFDKVIGIAPAGGDRSESVKNGLEFVPNDSFVMVHDGARPFISDATLHKCLLEARKGNNFIVGTYSTDTVKIVEEGLVVKTVERSKVFLAHTPQGFLTDELKRAYESGISGTDDSYIIEMFGGSVKVIEGNRDNIKITTRDDLRYL